MIEFSTTWFSIENPPRRATSCNYVLLGKYAISPGNTSDTHLSHTCSWLGSSALRCSTISSSSLPPRWVQPSFQRSSFSEAEQAGIFFQNYSLTTTEPWWPRLSGGHDVAWMHLNSKVERFPLREALIQMKMKPLNGGGGCPWTIAPCSIASDKKLRRIRFKDKKHFKRCSLSALLFTAPCFSAAALKIVMCQRVAFASHCKFLMSTIFSYLFSILNPAFAADMHTREHTLSTN